MARRLPKKKIPRSKRINVGRSVRRVKNAFPRKLTFTRDYSHEIDTFRRRYGPRHKLQGPKRRSEEHPSRSKRRIPLRTRPRLPRKPPVLHRDTVCGERHKRRVILFTLGKIGFSGSSPKRHYRRTIDSQFTCEKV